MRRLKPEHWRDLTLGTGLLTVILGFDALDPLEFFGFLGLLAASSVIAYKEGERRQENLP